MEGSFYKRRSSTLKLLTAVLVAASMICTACVMDSSRADTTEDSVLRMGFMQKIDSMNPNVGLVDASRVFYGLVYDCLQAVDEDLGSTPNIALGSGVEEDYEPYGSVWGFNLTENARWHDGTPLTADDVVFTVNLLSEYYSQMWAYQPYAYFMDYAEKVDDNTVRIHFYDRATGVPMPVAYGTSLFFPIMPHHMLETLSAADIGFNWEGVFDDSDPPLVGSGPFMATENIYQEFLQGDLITLVKNPNYHWAQDRSMEVRFDRIEMHFYDDATAMAFALEMGELDVAQFPPQEYLTIKDKVQSGTLTDIDTYDGPKCTQYWTEIAINMYNAGPNPSRLDPIIRQAMTMATDKTYIVDNYYLGLAEEGSTLIPPVNTEWHYELTNDEIYHYDLDAAEALLEAGGYRYTVDSPDVRVCTADSYAVEENLVSEGTLLAYEMAVRQEYPEEKDIAQYIQSEWAQIGIEMEYEIMPEPALGALVYAYAYDTMMWYWSSDPDPNYMLFCQSKYSWNGWNDNMYSTPEYEENFTVVVQELDKDLRKEAVDNCQRVHYEDAYYIILAYVDQTYAWRTDTIDDWGDWAENPGRSIDAYWGGNPFYFEPSAADYYAPVTNADLSGAQGENGWYTSDVTVTLNADTVLFDTTPPATTAIISGTSGENGWYVSDVAISLEAYDTSGLVESTWYSLDGMPWEEYASEIDIDTDGAHDLVYYSVDDAGNAENERTRYISIDTGEPSIVIPLDDGTVFDTDDVWIEWTCEDDMSGVDRCGYSLDGESYLFNLTTGVVLFDLENGEHSITVQVFDEAGNSGNDSLVFVVDALVPTTNRSVDYVWYDMFAHPLGSWYETRADLYGWEWPLTSEYPYLYAWEGMSLGDIWIYTFMRLNFTGRDLVELNMLSNPEFLPLLGDERGGTAAIDWYLNYITEEEAYATLPAPLPSYYDGWFFALNGTVTLDQTAASAVLDLPPGDFYSFDEWWATNQDDVSTEWEAWLNGEGNERLPIYNMYEYDLTFIIFELDAERIGDEIVVTLDTLSWGMEALMARWLHEAFMPTEWYMEDMNFHAVVGPHMADVDLDAAVAYSLSARESVFDGTPCWTWEARLQDYVESTPSYPLSDFDPYTDLEYLDLGVGSIWYDEMVPYDHTPGAWNLSENETLTFEWPSGEQLFIVRDVGATDGLMDDTSNLTANMTVRYAMPMSFDDPDIVKIDLDQRQITFTGPFDMWTWSQEQTAHEWLMDEWERLDVLPFGIPYIEFTADIENDPLEMQIDGLSNPLVIDLATAFTVTVVNATSQEVYTDYTGTVTFSSSDPGTALPSDYTFVPGVDAGSHDFVVIFVNVSSPDDPHWLTVRDVDLPYLMDVADDILVMYSVSEMSVGLSAALLSVSAPTLDSTMYRVDSGDWSEYESPFVLSDEGVHVVEFYSTDSLGTVEETKSITVKIDRTSPELEFVTANGTEFDNSSVMIAWNCSDGCSGIDRAEYSIDGAAYIACSAESYVDLVNLSDGAHVIQVRVYDEAGNMAEDDVQFDVKAVAEDDDDTNLLESLGFWQATAILAVVAALALGAMLVLRRRRTSPPDGTEGPPEDEAGPAEPPG